MYCLFYCSRTSFWLSHVEELLRSSNIWVTWRSDLQRSIWTWFTYSQSMLNKRLIIIAFKWDMSNWTALILQIGYSCDNRLWTILNLFHSRIDICEACHPPKSHLIIYCFEPLPSMIHPKNELAKLWCKL